MAERPLPQTIGMWRCKRGNRLNKHASVRCGKWLWVYQVCLLAAFKGHWTAVLLNQQRLGGFVALAGANAGERGGGIVCWVIVTCVWAKAMIGPISGSAASPPHLNHLTVS